jgi:hypothetical protein
MPHEQPTRDEPTTVRGAAAPPQPLGDEPLVEQEAWPDEAEELPPRPRRRVLTPLPLALLAALAIAGGFIAGVLVEKGQSGSSSAGGADAGGAFASRLAALRGGTSFSGGARSSSSSTGSGSTSSGAASGTTGPAGAAAAGGTAGGRSPAAGGGSATAGEVAYTRKGTLYVATSEGNTVKVTAAPGASVTKTVKANIEAIHPGEMVLVSGASGANGAISASSIRVGSIAGGLGGGAGLFGGTSGASGASGATSGSGSSAATSGGSEPQLFGKG